MDNLPPLPPLNDKLHTILRGPTMASNWVIPGVIMAGGYPGALDDRENDKQLKCLLNRGIDTFVCLQLEVDEDVPEEEWRAGYALRPYFADARKISKKPLVWRHLPILDGGAAEDDVMEALVCDLIDDIKSGRVLYVHCLGGHGRTGIVICLLLAVLYGLKVSEVFRRCQAYHDCRIEPQGVKSPSTVVQRAQVKRLLERWAVANKPGTPACEIALDPQISAPKEPEPPQMVVAKNGARGFVVSATMPSAPAKAVGKENAEFPLSTQLMKASMSKQQLKQPGFQGNSLLQSHAAMQNSSSTTAIAPRRQISMHQSQSTGALPVQLRTGRAAGTGAAAVQMIRKSSKQLALT